MKILERALASARNYEAARRVIGAESEMRNLMLRVVEPSADLRILDFGCGNGRLVPFVGQAQYVGIDNNPSYIRSAKDRNRQNNATFLCADLRDLASMDIAPCDVIVSIGVLHHLDDEAAATALEACAGLLKTSGRLVTMDPCFDPDQHPVARVLMALDRGKYVRHPTNYESLIGTHFVTDLAENWTDIYRFPYTHFVTQSRLRSLADLGCGDK